MALNLSTCTWEWSFLRFLDPLSVLSSSSYSSSYPSRYNRYIDRYNNGQGFYNGRYNNNNYARRNGQNYGLSFFNFPTANNRFNNRYNGRLGNGYKKRYSSEDYYGNYYYDPVRRPNYSFYYYG